MYLRDTWNDGLRPRKTKTMETCLTVGASAGCLSQRRFIEREKSCLGSEDGSLVESGLMSGSSQALRWWFTQKSRSGCAPSKERALLSLSKWRSVVLMTCMKIQQPGMRSPEKLSRLFGIWLLFKRADFKTSKKNKQKKRVYISVSRATR